MGAKLLFASIAGRFSRLEMVWYDGCYKHIADWMASWRPAKPVRLEVAERIEQGSKVLPRRRVDERTIAWLGRKRRLSKYYGGATAIGEAFVRLAMVHLIARRLAAKYLQ